MLHKRRYPQNAGRLKDCTFSTASDKFYILNMLNSHGYKIDTLLPENAPLYDLSGYDYIIMTDKVLISTVLTKTTAQTKTEYKIDKNGNAYFPEYRPFTCVYENTEEVFIQAKTKTELLWIPVVLLTYRFLKNAVLLFKERTISKQRHLKHRVI